MSTTNSVLRDRLLRQRRDRLGRNGSLGPTIKALHDLATLMEVPTRVKWRRGQRETDYWLITRSCYGPLIWWDRKAGRHQIKPLRTHRAERRAADAVITEVVKVLGSEYGTTITKVRAIADQLAVAAMAETSEASDVS
ncbi:hypothetical protein AB0E67_27420 [Streptomyces sp. NPDC032161]|uniref:hypothetical protein n=1 Tax=Streptomyces sp. NPDC032161 TaxID=3155253 RepID=UPI0033C1F100